MTRQEKILATMDRLAADTAKLAKLKKQARPKVCVDVYNEAIDANNVRAEELLEELKGLKGRRVPHAVIKAQQDMTCEACRYYQGEKCNDCFVGTYISSFDHEENEAVIAKRLQANSAKLKGGA